MKAKPTDASLHLLPWIYHSYYNWISLYGLRDLNCQAMVNTKTEVTCIRLEKQHGSVPWKFHVFLFAIKFLDLVQFYRHMFHGIRWKLITKLFKFKTCNCSLIGLYCNILNMPDVIVQLLACFSINTAIKTQQCCEIFAAQSREKVSLGNFSPLIIHTHSHSVWAWTSKNEETWTV